MRLNSLPLFPSCLQCALVASVSPRVYEVVVSVDADDFAMVGAFLADDLAGFELEIVYVEFERTQVFFRGSCGFAPATSCE